MFKLSPVAVKQTPWTDTKGISHVSYKATFVKPDGDTFAIKTQEQCKSGDSCVIDLVSRTMYDAQGKPQVVTIATISSISAAPASPPAGK